MKKLSLLTSLLLLFNIAQAPTLEAQILASPVFDVANNAIGAIAKVVANLSRAIREDILPWKERVSKIQDFFKKASERVSIVVKNLQMVNDLIEKEKAIQQLFNNTIQLLDASEDFEDKWKHRWILAQLYLKATEVFKLFDIATKEKQGIMDDENRIILIRDSLKRLRKIHTAMKVAIRRTNRSIYRIERTKKELMVFDRVFGEPQ